MPKITVAGGASSRHDPETAGAVTEPPASTAPAPDDVLRFDRELSEEEFAELQERYDGGASSPGKSSSASSETPEPSSEPSETAPRPRARTTASRSKKGRTADSSAPGTDGDPADDTSKA